MKRLTYLAIILISTIAFGIDFSFSGADLRNAINDIARTYNIQVILADDVTGTVDMTFQSSNFEDALQKVLMSTNYAFAKVGNVYLVGSMNSPDKVRATIYKPSMIFLKYVSAKVTYDLLGVLSKYVLYSPNSNILLVDADDQTKNEIASMISQIDLPNENRFFYYEIHEMNSDEYQRFRQIEQINKSGILTFSGTSFEIFREIMKINGKSDIFGNITIQTIGEGTVNLADPKFAMKVKSNQNTVNVSLITSTNAIQIPLSDQNSRAVASAQSGGKNFLVFIGFADNIKSDFALESQKAQNKLGLNLFYDQTNSKILSSVSYGSTELSIIGEIYNFRTSQGTTGIFVGVEGNLIDQMYGKIVLGLENMTPMVKFGIKDTTSIGFLMLRGELWNEMTLNGINPFKVSAGVGMDLWNIEVFGGIRGELQTAGPYIEIGLNYEWIRAKILWANGYTFGGGITMSW
ncbi:hypothetical protein [Athalassotoga saccharophila]|uniref:hypothetical protein n=1 Tax=Athalassotoga saccharophila TaxID=1441386 RepID=UPI001379F962|nr:hypothetical protein [Athalassotoga saccharophila]BBJ28006.1 type II and III secretion system protein [Athalassotoga saccharophila]